MISETEFKPWESDHTALVHVLWSLQSDGLLPRDVDCDRVASKIRQSVWMKAEREHAASPARTALARIAEEAALPKVAMGPRMRAISEIAESVLGGQS